MASTGILYIASGEKFIKEAMISAESAKEEMPEISIAIVTDRDIDSQLFDDVIVENKGEWRNDFGDHVTHIDKSPYEKTIKCDTDVYFDDSISDVFDLLENFDIALAQAPLRHSTNRINIPELTEVPQSFPEYQGGIIGFNLNEQFVNFLSEWRSAYRSTLELGEVSNQASLRAALYNGDCRIATLPDEYNCVYRMPGCVNGKVKVFHGRLIETGGKGGPKLTNVESAIETLNDDFSLRAYYRSGSKVKIAKQNLFFEFVDSLKREGFTYTIQKGLKRFENLVLRGWM